MSSIAFQQKDLRSAAEPKCPDSGARLALFTRWVLRDAVLCAVAIALACRLYSYLRPAEHTTDIFEAVQVFLNGWLAAFAIVSVFRLMRFALAERRFAKLTVPVAILGSNQHAQELYRAFTSDSAQSLAEPGAWQFSAKVWPEPRRATDFTAGSKHRCGIVAIPRECDTLTVALVEKSSHIFKDLYVAPQISRDGVTAKALVKKRSGLQIRVGEDLAHARTHLFKRAFDVTGALALGVAALPAAALIAALIQFTSEGPVFYKQTRIGKGNRLFCALKFRTMFVDSSERLNQCLAQDPALRAEWELAHKLKNDPRVTPIGRLLRRFSLDELPQIWNALVGEMSLVGPRPIVVSEIERYGMDYAAYEAVRPGLTGLWQVSGRNDTTYQQRVDFDAYYVRNCSLKLDAQIVAKTFRAVISGAGAY